MKQIIQKKDNRKTSTSSKDEAIKQWKEECYHGLIPTGISELDCCF
jgi:hypothetical protein